MHSEGPLENAASHGRSFATFNGVSICYETFGDARNTPIFLIAGAGSSMFGWPDEFCKSLAASRRFVVRYDHRDSGESSGCPPGQPGYGLRELVNDAVGLVEALNLHAVHLVGISMGGGIAQLVARAIPENVSSLTLIATTTGDPGLPPPTDEFLAFAGGSRQPDWADRDQVIEHILAFFRVLAGGGLPVDEDALRSMLARDLDRATTSPASTYGNHFAIDTEVPDLENRPMPEIPILVVHGSHDPLFPVEHAHALADRFPKAQLQIVDSAGHILAWQATRSLTEAILYHTEVARE